MGICKNCNGKRREWGVINLNKDSSIQSKPANSSIIVKAICIVLILTAIITGAIYYNKNSGDQKSKSDIEKVVEMFLTFAAKQDYEKAKEMATGLVLFNISNTKTETAKAHMVSDINTSVSSADQKWSVVKAELETINPKNSINAHWFTMYLVKDGIWKIYKVVEEDPVFVPGKINESDIENAKNVFIEFCNAVFEKRYDEAGIYLVGRAKNNHEQAGNILKDAVITDSKFKIHSVEPLSGNKKNLILNINYNLGGRDIKTIVSYYKTSRGWKIYNVSQI
jgi:hypothetical protein